MLVNRIAGAPLTVNCVSKIVKDVKRTETVKSVCKIRISMHHIIFIAWVIKEEAK